MKIAYKRSARALLVASAVCVSASVAADARYLRLVNVDYEGRTLYENEFEHVRDGVPGRRLGHAIRDHYNKSYDFLRARCTRGGGSNNRYTSYGGASYWMTNTTRAIVTHKRLAIDYYSKNGTSGSRRGEIPFRVRSRSDSFGIKVIGCTGPGTGVILSPRNEIQYATIFYSYGPNNQTTHEGAPKSWYINTSYPE